MKTVIALLVGSMLTQASKEIPNNPELRKERKEFRMKVRQAKKQARLINRMARLEVKLKDTIS